MMELPSPRKRTYNTIQYYRYQSRMKPRPLSAQGGAAGTFAKKIQPYQLAKQDKCPLGVIHPLSATKPRHSHLTVPHPFLQLVASKAVMKPSFQDRVTQKPIVSEELVKPFLYVEQVVPKRKTEKTVLGHPDVWQPTNTGDSTRKPKRLVGAEQAAARKKREDMASHQKESLYDIESQKRNVAKQLFGTLYLLAPSEPMKKSFWRWAKDKRLKIDRANMPATLSHFIAFMEEYSDGKVSAELATQFFHCFKRQTYQTLYIKALSYNFEGFRRSKVEVSNILSDKAAKTRFLELRVYVDNWNSNFPDLSGAIKEMGVYENSLRRYFLELRDSYENPHLEEIEYLKRQLEEPMIKYDAVKKKDINTKVEKYLEQHSQKKQRVDSEYSEFVAVFEDLIVENHNMFFRKKTILDLLSLLINESPSVTREHMQAMVAREQASCQEFLQVLSNIIQGFCMEKGKLKEERFTLIELANYVHRSCSREFEVESIRELVRLLKEQYCLRENKAVDDLDEFPGDQDIELSLLNTCFQIECTKILFKNDVWSELMGQVVVPDSAYQSKFHSETINKNITFESIKRLLEDIDKALALELSKSKELSRFVSTVDFDHFGEYANILVSVDVSEGLPANAVTAIEKAFAPAGEAKKVKFGDMIFTNMSSLREAVGSSDKREREEEEALKNPEYRALRQQEEEATRRQEDIRQQALALSKGVIEKSKKTFEESILFPAIQHLDFDSPQYLSPDIGMKTLTKSFLVPEPINMNALDAKFHERTFGRVEEMKMSMSKMQYKPTAEEDIHLMGKSVLLAHLPRIQELPDDPLRVSKYLMTTLEKVNEEVAQVINHQKKECKNIKEGVDSNYYKEMVDLERRPYKVDCEGTSKYSLVLPVDYYSSVMAQHDKSGSQEKWYLKPHHVETLTEHPKSKKDNFVASDYQVNMDNIAPKKSAGDIKREDNIHQKDVLIDELEHRLSKLREELSRAKRGPVSTVGGSVPPQIVEDYFNRLSKNKENKELEEAASEGILYDLRSQERGMLNNMRQHRLDVEGVPQPKWWEKSDKTFVEDYAKNRMLVEEEGLPSQLKSHTNYVASLQSSELY